MPEVVLGRAKFLAEQPHDLAAAWRRDFAPLQVRRMGGCDPCARAGCVDSPDCRKRQAVDRGGDRQARARCCVGEGRPGNAQAVQEMQRFVARGG